MQSSIVGSRINGILEGGGREGEEGGVGEERRSIEDERPSGGAETKWKLGALVAHPGTTSTGNRKVCR